MKTITQYCSGLKLTLPNNSIYLGKIVDNHIQFSLIKDSYNKYFKKANEDIEKFYKIIINQDRLFNSDPKYFNLFDMSNNPINFDGTLFNNSREINKNLIRELKRPEKIRLFDTDIYLGQKYSSKILIPDFAANETIDINDLSIPGYMNSYGSFNDLNVYLSSVRIQKRLIIEMLKTIKGEYRPDFAKIKITKENRSIELTIVDRLTPDIERNLKKTKDHFLENILKTFK